MINIKSDSRKIMPGDIFVALRGISSDGHEYIDKAISKGASKLIVEDDNNYSVPYEVVHDTREYLNKYLIDNYSSLINEMNIIGITGTNGKTTSAYLLYQALNKLGKKCAYIGTLGYFLEQGKVIDLPNTSPDICDLYELIIDAHDKGYGNIVLEASSQGLVRGRLNGIKYNYGIFTNLTQDHLDEHKTMENYALAKKILFDNIKDTGFSVVNYDDNYKDLYVTKNNVFYGFKNGDFKIINAKYTNKNTIFTYCYKNQEYQIITNMLGDYNIYNALSVIAVLTLMEFNSLDIKRVMSSLENPSGRLDIINYKTNAIIIDYAHTPDAILNILRTAKLITKGNIYVVFGCTGERDRTKRPIMMDIVTTNSKYAIVTVDDPYNEDPVSIVNDMLEGNKNKNYEIILDRGKAIERAISLLNEEDTLLVLGKGHEEFIIGKEKIPFNDRRKVEELLNQVFNKS